MDLTANDPELNGKFLGTLTSDFVKTADAMKEASYQIRTRNLSKHPIFVMCRESQPIGALLYRQGENGLEWNYFASMAEEFVQRKIIDDEAVPSFESAYKDPDEFCCLFVVDPEFTNFVFIPYPED